ncbi:MAG: hypothetical protein M1835_003157 [Candelina submexicana]|nr:MAG: hypothetical protein M1835_003157 [Candelina submexicana]
MVQSSTSPAAPPSFNIRSSLQGLTPSQVATYHTNGYLIISNALNPETVASLLSSTKQMLEDFPLNDHPMTRFSTGEGSDKKHVGDDYFLTSGDKVRFFFEEDAFSSTGELTKPKQRAINKIGHALHLHPPFDATTISPLTRSIAHSLSFHNPLVLQSMIICKQPEIGGAVPSHQDSTFLYTNPPSAVGFWFALEDATIRNGALGFWRGSHRRVGIGKRFVSLPEEEGAGTGFVDVEGARFPRVEGSNIGEKDGEVDEGSGEFGSDGQDLGRGSAEEEEEGYRIEEVRAGTLVIIHGNVLHKSERNTSGKSRFVYTFHVIEGDNSYDERNWLQPNEKGFTRLFE